MSVEVQGAIRAGEFDSLPPELNPQFHRLLAEDGVEQYAALLREAMDPANLREGLGISDEEIRRLRAELLQ